MSSPVCLLKLSLEMKKPPLGGYKNKQSLRFQRLMGSSLFYFLSEVGSLTNVNLLYYKSLPYSIIDQRLTEAKDFYKRTFNKKEEKFVEAAINGIDVVLRDKK